MTILKRYHLNHNASYKFVLKIVTCIVISCLCKYYNEKTISKSLEYGSKNDMSLDRRTHRALARYEKQNDIRNIRIQYNVPPNEQKYKIANVRENKNTYEHLKRGSSNHMEAYLKCYNQRYNKKKGLKKLDCIFEKKLFNSLHKIEKIAAQKNTGKNGIKKLLYKKYGLPFISLSLIPLFGLILPIKYFNNLHTKKNCKVVVVKIREVETKGMNHVQCEFLSEAYIYLNYFIVYLSFFMIFFLIIYMIIKVAKYDRIKKGY